MLPRRQRLIAWLQVLGIAWVATACGGPEEAGEGERVTGGPEIALRFIDSPAGDGAMAPNLAMGPEGPMLTWLEPEVGGHVLLYSHYGGSDWSSPRPIAGGDSFFANWADLPQAAAAANGTLYAHHLRKLGEDTYAYGVEVSRSTDGGGSWDALGLLHDDASPTEHGFVSYAPLPEGGVQAFWLDGRAMLGGGAMQLRSAILRPSVAPEPRPGQSELLDERVCECCATDAASTAAGPIVAYRDRGPSEVRDIAVVRTTPTGWSEPVLVHRDEWQIHGCPVNGPAVAAGGARVVVAWFTAGGGHARVQAAVSEDGGASFQSPVLVDGNKPLGRVDLALGEDGSAYVAWLAASPEGAEIRWLRIPTGSREPGPSHLVAVTSAQRSAGVPRLEVWEENLVFVWVDNQEPSRLRSALVPISPEG